MIVDLRSIPWLLSVLLLVSITGCQQGDHPKGQNDVEQKLFFFDGYPLHAKIAANVADGTLMLITLGADAETTQPIKAEEIQLAMKHGNHVDKFTFTALPESRDPEGLASLFSVKSVHLAKAFAGKAGRSAELLLTLDGKQLVGRLEDSHHDHGHDHHGHDHHGHDHDHHAHANVASNVLLWHEDIVFEGYSLRLGQHGLVVQAGSELEPAVSIEREGEPVRDAKVYVSLLDAAAKQIIAKPQETIFEAATDEEPAHYAQGFLFVPEDVKKVTIRYRIDFTDGSKTERDILIQTESHEH